MTVACKQLGRGGIVYIVRCGRLSRLNKPIIETSDTMKFGCFYLKLSMIVMVFTGSI